MSEFEPEFIHEATDKQLIKELLSRATFKPDYLFELVGGRAKLLKKIPIKTLLSEAFDRKNFKLDRIVEQLNETNLSFILSVKKDHRIPETWLRGNRAAVLRMLREIMEEVEREHSK